MNQNEPIFDVCESTFPFKLQLLRKSKMFTDVKIKIGDLEIEAHRMVLEDSSPVIKAMLHHQGNILEFNEEYVDPKIIEDLLDFIYDVPIKITNENACSLCLASDFLDLQNLFKKCKTFLSHNFSSENILDLYFLSIKYEFSDLKKSCAEFIAVEGENVLENEKLLSLNFKDLEGFFEKMNVGNQNNENLKKKMFKFVISWVKHDSQTREYFLPNLLKLLPLHELPYDFFMEHISQDSFIANSSLCSELVNEALNKIHSSLNLKYFPVSLLNCLDSTSVSEFIESFNEYFFEISDEKLNQIGSIRYKKPLPKIISNLQMIRATVIGNKIYVLKEKIVEGIDTDLFVFDCENETWSTIIIWFCYNEFAIAYLNGYIYVSGTVREPLSFKNRNENENESEIQSESEIESEKENNRFGLIIYSPETEVLIKLKSMNHDRNGHSLVALNDKIYAIGGNQDYLKIVEYYDPSTDVWTDVASIHYEHQNGHAISHFNKIYVLSSEGFEVYHPAYNTWQILPSLDIGEKKIKLVSSNGKLLAIQKEIIMDPNFKFRYCILRGKKYRKNDKRIHLGVKEFKYTIFEFKLTDNSWLELSDDFIQQIQDQLIVLNF